MTVDAETIPLLVTFGFPGDGTFNLRFPPEQRDEIESLLDDNGIDHGTILELSAGQDLAIEAVKTLGPFLGAGGGLAALAAVIKAFAHRHDGKRVVIKDGEREIEVAGLSQKAIVEMLNKKAEQQAKRDAAWSQAVKQTRPDEND